MLDNRSDPMEGRVNRRSWKRYRPLAALLAVGVMGAGAALAVDRVNHPPAQAGQGCWNSLRGALKLDTKLILALDENFDVQGFFGPRGQDAKDPGGLPVEEATIELSKFGSATVYCYKIGGEKRCIED